MNLVLKGKVWKFGDNIDTDVIIAAKYLNTTDEKELALHCMEGIEKDFAGRVSDGDIIVAGANFGCGSSREHAPVAIKACGISCVLAESFARIFFRNAINIGLPILEIKGQVREIKAGDKIEVDLKAGEVRNLTTGKKYRSQAYPAFMQELVQAGGPLWWL